MNSIAAIRAYADARLKDRVPSAFLVPECEKAPVLETGVPAIDQRIGGLPSAAITELCSNPLVTSGADSLLIALLAKATEEHYCAVIDGTDSFNPRWAHSAGIDLKRLLWVRCQEQGSKKGRGRLDQALYAADLLLKANCGFGVMVVDLADIPERLLRQVPLEVWYRFRLAAEKLTTTLIFSTPVPVTGTSSALVLRFDASQGEWISSGPASPSHARLLNGFSNDAEVTRSRDRKKNVHAVRFSFNSRRAWA